MAQTNEGQRNFADLQKKYDPKRQQLKTLSDEIDSLTKQLQTQGDKLSEAERASRAKTIDDKKKQLQRDAEDAQNDMQQEMQEIYNTLASKVYDVLASYAQQHGYTLVLDVAQQQTPVLYASRIDQHHQGSHRSLQREVGRACSAAVQPAAAAPAPQGARRSVIPALQATQRPRSRGLCIAGSRAGKPTLESDVCMCRSILNAGFCGKKCGLLPTKSSEEFRAFSTCQSADRF